MGIDDVNEEFYDCKKSMVLDNTYYRFKQKYKGIPVYGRNLVVCADQNFNGILLTGNYQNIDGIQITPAISEKEAERTINERGKSKVIESKGLTIYSLFNIEPVLTWEFVVNTNENIENFFCFCNPGPIAVNSATFVGIRLAGFLGALAATFGCILPSCILVTVLSYLYLKYRKMSMLQGVLETLRPAVVSMIAAAGVSILITAFWERRGLFCIIFAALENCRKNLKNLKNGLLFIKFYAMIVFVPGCGSAWLERRLREAEVASSNPATPIHCKVLDFQGLFLCYVSCCNPVFTFCNASGIAPLHGKTSTRFPSLALIASVEQHSQSFCAINALLLNDALSSPKISLPISEEKS